MHVLGTPPAFILSQDQTLKFHSELSIPNPLAWPWKKCSGRIFLLNFARHPKTPGKTLKGFLYLLSGFQRRSHAPQHSPKAPSGPLQHPAASTTQDIQTTSQLFRCKKKFPVAASKAPRSLWLSLSVGTRGVGWPHRAPNKTRRCRDEARQDAPQGRARRATWFVVHHPRSG